MFFCPSLHVYIKLREFCYCSSFIAFHMHVYFVYASYSGCAVLVLSAQCAIVSPWVFLVLCAPGFWSPILVCEPCYCALFDVSTSVTAPFRHCLPSMTVLPQLHTAFHCPISVVASRVSFSAHLATIFFFLLSVSGTASPLHSGCHYATPCLFALLEINCMCCTPIPFQPPFRCFVRVCSNNFAETVIVQSVCACLAGFASDGRHRSSGG